MKSKDTHEPAAVIGWREWIALPEIGVPGVKAKIDTGARTSALHTHDYQLFERDGAQWVRFHIHPLRRTSQIELTCEAEVSDMRQVKDSGGHVELRPFIKTAVSIGGIEFIAEISLTNREQMKFRMLLGRTALRHTFLVNPAGDFLLSANLSKKYDIPRS
ncbi:MAG: hypothetical protein ACI8UO_003612 [Verrucomicrobiales bacterium]|jgi:hypothetical protein